MKPLEETKGENACDFLSNEVLNTTIKFQFMKEKRIDKSEFIKFLTSL